MHSKLELNQLRILVALHEMQNVSQVAHTLKMSQPSVSVALNKLRETLNDPLFIKTPGGMRPTVRASRLISPVRTVLATIDGEILANIAFDPTSTRRTFTFGLSAYGEILFLPRLARHIRSLAPHATIQSVAPPRPAIERGLESGDIDLVLGYRPDLKKTNYVQQKLLSMDHMCLVRADHPIRGERLTASQFVDLEHILIRAENRAHEELEQYLAKKRIRRKIAIHTPHLTSIPLLLSESNLVVTLPGFLAKHIARHYPNTKMMFPDLDLPTVDVKQYWHRRFHDDAANKWLRKSVAQLFQAAGSRRTGAHGQDLP